MKKALHYHKYERLYWPNGKPFYKCMLVGCKHYLPIADLVINRESICWGPSCNKLVVITKEDVRREVKYPMCTSCKEERAENKEALRNIS